jgi:hypothetical protein
MTDYDKFSKEELIVKLKDKDAACTELENRCRQFEEHIKKLELQVNRLRRLGVGKASEKSKEFITDADVVEESTSQSDETVQNSEESAMNGGKSIPVQPSNINVKENPKRYYKKVHLGRHQFSKGLPVVVVYLSPEGESDSFGEEIEEVVSRQLVTRMYTYMLETRRKKYVKNGVFSIAKIPEDNIFFKHRLHLETVAFILMMRYGLHTPYKRIHSIIPEPTLTYNTLVESACRGAEAFLPLAPVLLEEVKSCKRPETALGIDESPFDVLDTPANIEAFKKLVAYSDNNADSEAQPPSEGAKQELAESAQAKGPKKVIHTGRVWMVINPEAGLTYCHYTGTRQKSHPEAFLNGYKGPVMSDAYSGYLSIAKNKAFFIILMLCWAHARRHFTDLIINVKNPDPVAKEIVRLIGLLYKIEEKIKGKTPEEKLEARKESRKILDEQIKPYLDAKIKLYTPKESMHDAIDYILRNWPYFVKYTEILGGVIDNNFSERALRPTTLNRKNSLFFGSVKCAAGSAIMLSLVQSCKLNGVDVSTWITDVLGRITTYPKEKLADLLPHKWQPPTSPPQSPNTNN